MSSTERKSENENEKKRKFFSDFFSIEKWPSKGEEEKFWNKLEKISHIKFLKKSIQYKPGDEVISSVDFFNNVRFSSIEKYKIKKEKEEEKEKKYFILSEEPCNFISIIAGWQKEDLEEEDLGAKYVGTSLVFFPSYKEYKKDENNNEENNKKKKKGEEKKYEIEPVGVIVAMGLGTGGPSLDEELLSNPGHIRRFEGMINSIKDSIKNGESLIWFRKEPLKHKPVPDSFIEKVENLFGAKVRALQLRKDGKGGYGEYLYAVAALKFKDDGDGNNECRLSKDQKEILEGFIQFYARERGLTKNTKDDFAKKWYENLFKSPTTEDIKEKLKTHKYIILTGPPGTGKTAMMKEIANSDDFRDRHISIQFHPNTTYQSFVGGIQPKLDNDNNNEFKFEFKRGALIEAIEEAQKSGDKPYLLVIDEINRADLATVLGEAIVLFEPGGNYKVKVANYKEKELQMPANLYVLCAMNTADRNITSIDVAIRRRFAFVNIWPKEPEDSNNNYGKELFKELNDLFMEYGDDNDLLLMPGGFYFLGSSDDEVKERVRVRLLPLLEDYLNENRISRTLRKEIELFIQKLKLEL